jgi:hypothetical protein
VPARSEQRDAVAIDHHADLLNGAGEPQPGGAVVGRLGDDLAEQHHAVADIVFLERRVGVAPQLARAACLPLPASVLTSASSLIAAFVEIAALEGFAGGRRRNGTEGKRRKGDERGNEADADMREHGLSSSSPLRRKFPRGRPSKHNPESCPGRDRETAEICWCSQATYGLDPARIFANCRRTDKLIQIKRRAPKDAPHFQPKLLVDVVDDAAACRVDEVHAVVRVDVLVLAHRRTPVAWNGAELNIGRQGCADPGPAP